mgnify:CR=1 FL=1
MSNDWKLASAYVTGRAHLAKHIPCQDRTFELIDKHSTGVFYGLSLADGAGSYKFSDIGAEIVTKKILKYLKSNFAKLFKTRSISSKITKYIEKILYIEANNRAIDIKELSSTLLFVVLKNDKFIVGHIGDGVIGVLDKLNNVSVLSHPDNGEYSNSTFFTTTGNYPDRLRIVRGNIVDSTGFILMSDGSHQSLYDSRTKQLAPINAKIVNWLNAGNSEEVKIALKQNLNNIIKQKTFDDCSLGILKKC